MQPAAAKFLFPLLAGVLSLVTATVGSPAYAEQYERAELLNLPRKTGPSDLPVPRFVSLKSNEVNMRIGPSRSHAVDWVYRGYKGLPVLVIAESGQWRKIADHEGVSGWVHRALLAGTRTVRVEGAGAVGLRLTPNRQSDLKATVAPGATGRLEACRQRWCRAVFSGLRGWVPRNRLWGVLPGETAD